MGQGDGVVRVEEQMVIEHYAVLIADLVVSLTRTGDIEQIARIREELREALADVLTAVAVEASRGAGR